MHSNRATLKTEGGREHFFTPWYCHVLLGVQISDSTSVIYSKNNTVKLLFGRRGGLMVCALDSGASGPGSNLVGDIVPVVFLGKTLYSHGASLHPGV